MRRVSLWYWKLVNRIDHSINESIEYSLPQLNILGVVGLVGFPVFYWIWHDLFPQPYDNLALNLIGCLLSGALIQLYLRSSQQTPRRKLFWIFVFTFELSFFFTFMLLKNNCNMVWTMSTMAGLMLLVLIAHDWLLATLMHIVGSLFALTFYLLTTSTPIALESYAIQIPIYFFVVIAGGLFNYQSATIRQARLKALASVGASLAHELRTPLLGIEHQAKKIEQNLASLSLDAQLDHTLDFATQDPLVAALNKSVSLTQREVKHANTIIDMFLLDLGSKNIYERKFAHHSAIAVVEKAIDRYPFASDLERNKISVSKFEDFKFYGSDLLLMHVLFNLIKNALNHLDKNGEICISVDASDGRQSIAVHDTGTGIAASNLAYIFNEFYTSGAASRGTGVGLAFCKKVMRHFDGNIECESELGSYTLFRLDFPVVADLHVADQHALPETIPSGQKLLAIDSPNGSLQTLHSSLVSSQNEVVWADGLSAVFVQLKTRHFDAIIVNTDRQDKRWIDSVRGIRSGEYFSEKQCTNFQEIPILVLGDNIDARTESELIALGISVCRQRVEVLTAEAYQRELTQSFDLASLAFKTKEDKSVLAGKSVLVVDDHDINYQHICSQLEVFKVDVHFAVDGKTAIKLLDEKHFDFIFMDLYMPGQNGWQVTEQIRQGDVFSSFKGSRTIPIIGLSGDPRSEMLQRCLASGFNTLLYKPVGQAKLVKTLIEQHANRNQPFDAKKLVKAGGSDELSAEHLEPETKFLHDILTPLLIIENGNSLIKETVSSFLDNSPELNSGNPLSMVQVTSEVEKQTSILRERINSFWLEVRAIANPAELALVRESFVSETESLWSGIENTLLQGGGLGRSASLPESAKEELNDVNQKIYQGLSSGRELIQVYAKSSDSEVP